MILALGCFFVILGGRFFYSGGEGFFIIGRHYCPLDFPVRAVRVPVRFCLNLFLGLAGSSLLHNTEGRIIEARVSHRKSS